VCEVCRVGEVCVCVCVRCVELKNLCEVCARCLVGLENVCGIV
jgi:hypothetical protein